MEPRGEPSPAPVDECKGDGLHVHAYDWSSLVSELCRAAGPSEPQRALEDPGPAEPSVLKRLMSRSLSDAGWSSDESEKESEGLLELLRHRDDLGAGPGDGAGSPGDEERLWKSLCVTDDPHHPLNFQARHFGSAPEEKTAQSSTLVPWKRPGASRCPEEEHKELAPSKTVHVMRSWRFARQASRKGHWEELARDRAHFQRRIQQVEQAIGHCFTASHRTNIRMYVDLCLGRF